MFNARIENNIPICGNCGSGNLSGTRDYKQVKYKGESLTLFINHCYNCKEDNRYLSIVTLEKSERVEIEDVLEEIRE